MSQINLSNWEIVDDVDNSRIVIRSRSTAEQLELNESGVFTSSSGIDADTVDGVEGSKIFENTGDTLSGTLNMASNKIVGLDAPTQDDEAARKSYVDSTSEGLDVKEPVQVCTCGQGNIDLSSSNDPNPIDGFTLQDGERVLLVEQSDASQNGIYKAVEADDPVTWIRTQDADEDDDVNGSMFVLSINGNEGGGVGFVLITPDPITVGTTDLEFTRFSSPESIEAGDNISRTGSRLDVVGGSGSGLDADTVDGVEASALGASAGDNLSKNGNTLNVVGGSGSGLDADTVDGQEASALGANAGSHLSKSNGTLHVDDGSGSGLDADTVDGFDVEIDGNDAIGVINFKTL